MTLQLNYRLSQDAKDIYPNTDLIGFVDFNFDTYEKEFDLFIKFNGVVYKETKIIDLKSYRLALYFDGEYEAYIQTSKEKSQSVMFTMHALDKIIAVTNEVRRQVLNYELSIDVSAFHMTSEEIQKFVINDFRNIYGIFCYISSLDYRFEQVDNQTYVKNIEVLYNKSYIQFMRMQKLAQCVADNILRRKDENRRIPTDQESIALLYEWITRYFEGTYGGGVEASDFLIDKHGVCDGIAKAFELIAFQMGIPCMKVGCGEISHAWNVAMIDGDWYHFDPTWGGANKGFAKGRDFMCSDKKFIETRGLPGRVWLSLRYQVIECDNTHYDQLSMEGYHQMLRTYDESYGMVLVNKELFFAKDQIKIYPIVANFSEKTKDFHECVVTIEDPNHHINEYPCRYGECITVDDLTSLGDYQISIKEKRKDSMVIPVKCSPCTITCTNTQAESCITESGIISIDMNGYIYQGKRVAVADRIQIWQGGSGAQQFSLIVMEPKHMSLDGFMVKERTMNMQFCSGDVHIDLEGSKSFIEQVNPAILLPEGKLTICVIDQLGGLRIDGPIEYHGHMLMLNEELNDQNVIYEFTHDINDNVIFTKKAKKQ